MVVEELQCVSSRQLSANSCVSDANTDISNCRMHRMTSCNVIISKWTYISFGLAWHKPRVVLLWLIAFKAIFFNSMPFEGFRWTVNCFPRIASTREHKYLLEYLATQSLRGINSILNYRPRAVSITERIRIKLEFLFRVHRWPLPWVTRFVVIFVISLLLRVEFVKKKMRTFWRHASLSEFTNKE